ncbi:hypothetical protein GW17_00035817 [Ensete ventricosum]|nr:hypothetical protein GW17_00035817 [Ensete ventricosum]
MAANKLYVAAVLIQLAYAGFHVISKAAFDKGMSTITWSFNMYNIGLKYTSASVASAATNSIPVFTFFLAVLLRLLTLLLTLSA